MAESTCFSYREIFNFPLEFMNDSEPVKIYHSMSMFVLFLHFLLPLIFSFILL